jgi:hypothetical protein
VAKRLRRPGSPWRILVHDYVGGDPCYGKSHDVTNDPRFGHVLPGRRAPYPPPDPDVAEMIELPGTEFDELVIGHWIHLEQMNAIQWWMNIGGVTVWVTADRDGRPRNVQVYGPKDYDAPVDGCAYTCTWTEVGA